MYNSSRADSYRNVNTASCREMQPHIFAVAARVHYRLIQDLGKPTQVIILNGETGTGKTFSAWKALEFLVATAIGNTSTDIQEVDTSYDIVRKVKDACRLISAFTTAPTEKNEVSSRHVQVVWLEYKKNNICGAKIASYLLERNRVTKGCCTYQIFNQVMTALADIEFADTGLSKEKQYFIVSDLNPLKEQQFREGFRDTLRAMDMLDFTINQKKNIFQVLSLIIHMGNIQFIQEDDCCRIDTDSEQSREAFENTCRLACLRREDLAELLTSTLISPQNVRRRHSMCRRNLSTKDACYHRLHSIIRHLYDLLFRWLIKSVNEILSTDLCQCNRLGILDIFGFECFDTNGVEQICVNYVNEKLQQYFIEKYVTSCQKDLQEEDLIEKEKSLNCSNILQLYEDRLNTVRKTLFAALNDTCLSTVPSDTGTLMRHVNATLSSNHSRRRFLKVKNENFVIRHYAGSVEYSCDDLFSKNTDKVPDELTITFSTSKNKFLHFLMIESDAYGKSSVKKRTMLSKLCYNVDWLIQELNECDAHYVRCVKLRRKRNTNWDRKGLYKQLANTGILHALPLAKCEYPVYFRYEDFCKRYYRHSGNSGNYGKFMKTCDIISKISESFPPTELKKADSSVYYGKNFIFLKEDFFLILESTRRQRHIESVKKIESFWIKYKNRQLEVKRTDAATNVSEANSPPQDNRNNVVVTNYQSKTPPLMYGINLVASQLGKPNTGHKVTRDCAMFRRALFDNQTIQVPEPYDSLQHKTSYIMKWLKDISETANIMDNTEATVSKQSSVTHDHNQSAHTSRNNGNRSKSADSNGDRICMWRKREKISGYYDKENDMYIIPHGGCTLFHKSGILSRRRPPRLPVKVHTRVTCLTNSHYSVHTELPQGLRDCL
ncbi:hypothetical protein DMN91_011032 [Ooceraea biroi]|uniref:Myosin motor domain-containing protein n=2 Tax=Ooceraea biroi TaxID=2015173 RepID=A0A3L8DA16_OOCBI|nr:hypothetical protein DMN91_011032 [Ooceraea biroi]